jgi:hypothetical protein
MKVVGWFFRHYFLDLAPMNDVICSFIRVVMFSIYVASLIMLRVNSPYNSLSS